MAAPTRLCLTTLSWPGSYPAPRQSYLGLNLLDFSLPFAEISLNQGLGTAQIVALQMSAMGSKAHIASRPRHVRCSPQS